jgi:hypothetical protein
MTGARMECSLPAETDPLSVVLPAMPAVSDRRVGIEGSPPGWLGTGYRGNTNMWPRRNGSLMPGTINRTRSRINAGG